MPPISLRLPKDLVANRSMLECLHLPHREARQAIPRWEECKCHENRTAFNTVNKSSCSVLGMAPSYREKKVIPGTQLPAMTRGCSAFPLENQAAAPQGWASTSPPRATHPCLPALPALPSIHPCRNPLTGAQDNSFKQRKFTGSIK